MATLNYRDPATGNWVAMPVYSGGAGPTGPAGATGPVAISTVAGNTAVLGSDGQLFVPDTGGLDPATASALYVDVPGDVMTGELLVPDQAVVNPRDPLVAAAKGYVDQLVTVSTVDPAGLPKREGQTWYVVGDSTAPPPPAAPTSPAGIWVDATRNRITWVDTPDPSVTVYEVYYSLVNAVRATESDMFLGSVGPGNQEITHTKGLAGQSTDTIYYAIRAVNANGASSLAKTSVTAPPRPPVTPVGVQGIWDNATTNRVTWVDIPGATGYEIRYNLTGAPISAADTLLGTVAPGVQTLTHTKDAAAQAAARVYYGITAVNAIGGSSTVSVYVNLLGPFLASTHGGNNANTQFGGFLEFVLPGFNWTWEGTDLVASWTGPSRFWLSIPMAFYPEGSNGIHPYPGGSVPLDQSTGMWREWDIVLSPNLLTNAYILVMVNWTPWDYDPDVDYLGHFYTFMGPGVTNYPTRAWHYMDWAEQGIKPPPAGATAENGYWGVSFSVLGYVPPGSIRVKTGSVRFAWDAPDQSVERSRDITVPLSPAAAAALDTVKATMKEKLKAEKLEYIRRVRGV